MNDPFIHPRALCESGRIGSGTRIWAFVHVLPEALIGSDCNICDHVFIENDVIVGDRVTVKSGVQLWDGITLEDDVFVGPNATFTNDPFPRSRQWMDEHPRTIVRRGASVGANATVLPGVEIGQGAMIGAGAVVTRSVPAHAIVRGNPARISGYTETSRRPDHPTTETDGPASTGPGSEEEAVASPDRNVPGVRLHRLPHHRDLRGELTVGEVSDLPFVPRRYFVVHHVPSKEVRGEHAHRECEQLLVCLHGSLRVMVDDGRSRDEFVLDGPREALYVPPMVWAAQFSYSEDAVLLVLASDPYDPDDYIRDYDDFIAVAHGDGAPPPDG